MANKNNNVVMAQEVAPTTPKNQVFEVKKLDGGSMSALLSAPATHTNAKHFGKVLVESIANENMSTIEAFARIRYFKEILDSAEESIKPLAIDEAKLSFRDEYNDAKKFSFRGVEFKVAPQGYKVPYEQDGEYADLQSKIAALEAEKQAMIDEFVSQACVDITADIIKATNDLKARKETIDMFDLLKGVKVDKGDAITIYLPK